MKERRCFWTPLLAVLIAAAMVSSVSAAEYPGSVYGPFFVGSKIWISNGAPAAGLGIDGDMYIDGTSGNLYNKTAGVWTLRGTVMNQTPGSGDADVLIWENVSTINTWLIINRSQIMANISFGDYSNLSVADDHILSNMSTVNTWINTNITGLNSSIDWRAAFNYTQINTTIMNMIAGNASAGGNWGLLILQNRTEVEQEIAINRSEIMLNVSFGDYSNLSVADSHIASNVSMLNTSIDQRINANISALNTSIDLRATYNYTQINTTIQNMIAGNASAGGGWSFTNPWNYFINKSGATYVSMKTDGTTVSSGVILKTVFDDTVTDATAGDLIQFAPGRYVFADAPAVIEKDLHIRGSGANVTTIAITAAFPAGGEDAVFAFKGTYPAYTTKLSASPAAGDSVISLVSAAALEAGDLIIVNDTADWIGGTDIGELHKVTDVDGNDVYLNDPLLHDFSTARNAIAWQSTPVRVSVSHLSIEGIDPTDNRIGVFIKNAVDSVVADVNIYNMGLTGVYVVGSYNTHVIDSHIYGSREDGEGYGVASAASAFTHISQNYIEDSRHAVSITYYGAMFGQDHGSLIENNELHGCNQVNAGNQVVDAHSGAFDLNVIGNEIAVSENRNDVNNKAAVASAARYNKIWGNDIVNGNIYDRGDSVPAASWDIRNNHFYNSIELMDISTHNNDVRSFIFKNNVLENYQGYLFEFGTGNRYYVDVSDNVVNFSASPSGYGMLMTNALSGSISRNILRGAPLDGILIKGSRYMEVNDNIVIDSNTANPAAVHCGINITNSHNLSVERNRVNDSVPNQDYAICEDSTSGYNFFFENDLSGYVLAEAQINGAYSVIVNKTELGFLAHARSNLQDQIDAIGGGGGGNDGFSNLSESDRHLVINRSEIMLNITFSAEHNLTKMLEMMWLNATKFGNDTANKTVVAGPTSATDGLIALADGTSGRLIKFATDSIASLKASIFTAEETNRTAQIKNLSVYKTNRANISIPAQSMVALENYGATEAVNLTSNGIYVITMDYPELTDSVGLGATGTFIVPGDFSGAGFYGRVLWTADSGAAGNTVNWSLKMTCVGDDGAVNTAMGDNVSVSDTLIAIGDLHVSPWSTLITPGGTPIAGGQCWPMLNRSGGNLSSAGKATAMEFTHD